MRYGRAESSVRVGWSGLVGTPSWRHHRPRGVCWLELSQCKDKRALVGVNTSVCLVGVVTVQGRVCVGGLELSCQAAPG
jgi:hypothetical protein